MRRARTPAETDGGEATGRASVRASAAPYDATGKGATDGAVCAETSVRRGTAGRCACDTSALAGDGAAVQLLPAKERLLTLCKKLASLVASPIVQAPRDTAAALSK